MELLCAGALMGLVMAGIIFGSGVVYGDCDCDICDCVGDSDDTVSLGNTDKRVDSGQDMGMDAEVATIALENVKRDMNKMLSTKEQKAIEYAIYTINSHNIKKCTSSDIKEHAKKLGVKLGAEDD